MQTTETAVATPVFLRQSERATFRDCRLKHRWSYTLRLAPPQIKGALEFGRMTHKALELYYPPGRKRGVHPAQTFAKLYAEDKKAFSQWDDEGNKIDALDLGVGMLEAYVDKWGADDHINILQPEIPLAVDVRDKQGRYLCTWVGRGDALYEDLSMSNKARRRIGFLEHKTAKTIEANLRVNSGYGDQAEGYWWAGSITMRHRGIIKPNENIDHVLINWLRKALPDTRPRNAQGHALNQPTKEALVIACETNGIDVHQFKKPTVKLLEELLTANGFDPMMYGEPSKRQSSPLFDRVTLDFGDGHLEQVAWRIRAEAYERSLVLAGKLPAYKNPSRDCSWKCPFVEACELHEMGGDWESVLELEFVEHDPYEDYAEEFK